MDYVYKLAPVIQVVIAVCSSYLLLARFRYQSEIQNYATKVLEDYKRDSKSSYQLLSYLALTPQERKISKNFSHMWFSTVSGFFYKHILVKDIDNRLCLFIIFFWITILYEASYCYANGNSNGFFYELLMEFDFLREYRYVLLHSEIGVSFTCPLVLVFAGRKIVDSAKSSTDDLKSDLQEKADKMDKKAASIKKPDLNGS